MNGKTDLTHISLFTGIGGFDLAAGWAGFRTIAMCEIDPFCQEVLRARFGAVADADKIGRGTHARENPARQPQVGPLLIPDIHDFDGRRFRGATLLTGGFPCQPFSCAGKRRGKEDDRYLWPEMLRVIEEVRPAWIVGENVAGIINMELDQACTDLEGEGYSVRPIIIPACAVNAPHRRDRVWIIAHCEREALRGEPRILECPKRNYQERPQISREFRNSPSRKNSLYAASQNPILGGNGGRGDGDTPRLRRALQTQGSDSDAPDAEISELHDSASADSQCLRCQVGERMGDGERVGQGQERTHAPEGSWGIPWIEVATRLCRVDDGLPPWVHARRVARLKALGNAIVPQVAYQIIKAISDIERGKT